MVCKVERGCKHRCVADRLPCEALWRKGKVAQAWAQILFAESADVIEFEVLQGIKIRCVSWQLILCQVEALSCRPPFSLCLSCCTERGAIVSWMSGLARHDTQR